jgi:DNA-binding response OmpR family regulator
MSAHILLVDDDLLVLDLMEQTLSEAGFAVTVASRASDALSQLEHKPLAFAGLVTDINLGTEMDGFGLAQRARDLIPALPVVYVTGDSSHRWQVSGVPESVLLTKPFVPDEIVVAMHSLLNVEPSQCA